MCWPLQNVGNTLPSFYIKIFKCISQLSGAGNLSFHFFSHWLGPKVILGQLLKCNKTLPCCLICERLGFFNHCITSCAVFEEGHLCPQYCCCLTCHRWWAHGSVERWPAQSWGPQWTHAPCKQQRNMHSSELSFNPMWPVFNSTEIPSKRSKEQNVTGIIKEIPLGLDCPVWSSGFFCYLWHQPGLTLIALF